MLEWTLDGPVGASFLVLLALTGLVYLGAVRRGERLDRRGRRWPRQRSACFLGGLLVLVIDLYSEIGIEADLRLTDHMVEHMVMWLVVAPLLAAGAPVRLAFYALPRAGRHRLGRWLRSRPVSVLTSPVGSVSVFSAVLLIAHVPAVYGLTLRSDFAHETEHGLFLLTSLLVWAPLLGVDPLPHRPSRKGQALCMLACMVPMALVAAWLSSAAHPVYGHYVALLGQAALSDQRHAAMVMWIGGIPGFAVPAIARYARPRRVGAPRLSSRRVPA